MLAQAGFGVTQPVAAAAEAALAQGEAAIRPGFTNLANHALQLGSAVISAVGQAASTAAGDVARWVNASDAFTVALFALAVMMLIFVTGITVREIVRS